MVRRLPPPATGAHILTWLNSTGTWLTTYAWVSTIMQLIIRNTVFLDIIPHLLFRPRDEGIHLDELVHLVPLYNLHILTGNALFTTQATYPYIKTLKGTLEGFELTNLAATVTALNTIIEKVNTLFTHHPLHFMVVGEEHLYLYAVCHIRLFYELICLREETPRVKSEYTGIFVLSDNDIRQCLILNRQRGRKSDAPLVCLEEIADDLLGGRIAKTFI